MRVRIAPIVVASLIALAGGQTQAAVITFEGPSQVDQGGEILINVVLRSDGDLLFVRGTEFYLEVASVGGAPTDGVLFSNLVSQPYTQANYIFPGDGAASTSEKEQAGQPVAVTLLNQFDPITGLPLPAGGDSRYFGGSDEFDGPSPGAPVTQAGVIIAQLRLRAGANTPGGSQYVIRFAQLGDNQSSLDADESGGVGNPFVATATITVQGEVEPPDGVIPAPPGLVLGLIAVPFVGLVARRSRKATA